MIWTGNPLHVIVTPKEGMGGRFASDNKTRPVYALKDGSGDVSVLVSDDDGNLTWVSTRGTCTVAAPPRWFWQHGR